MQLSEELFKLNMIFYLHYHLTTWDNNHMNILQNKEIVQPELIDCTIK